MSIASDGILAYGYDLGEAYDIETPEEYENDKTQYLEDLLLEKIAGFTEKWAKDNEGYFDRKRAAEAALGVELIIHCSYEYPMYILAAAGSEHRAWRGSPTVIESLEIQTNWNLNLRIAADVLGIPNMTQPQWLLASVMG